MEVKWYRLFTGECCHVLAAKINLGMATGKEKIACNLTVLRKRMKDPRKKKDVVERGQDQMMYQVCICSYV